MIIMQLDFIPFMTCIISWKHRKGKRVMKYDFMDSMKLKRAWFYIDYKSGFETSYMFLRFE